MDHSNNNNNNNNNNHHEVDFSPEDIQALLAGVGPDHIMYYDHHTEMNSPSLTATASHSNTVSHASLQHRDEDDNNKRSKLQPEQDTPADRIERKRRLEKQRRCEVNLQFQHLQACLKQLEQDNCEPLHGLPAYSPANRVELLGRTVAVLEAYHQAHQQLLQEVQHLTQECERAQKAGEETAAKLKEQLSAPQAVGNNKVMMMVPMIIGGNNNEMTPYMPNMMGDANSQWMFPPQAMMMPSPFMMAPAQGGQPAPTATGKTERSSNDSSPSSSTNSNEMGGNLAHCA
ncbi:hypothetical protein FisN_26Hh117 [Fistulifera solaris]|uniref:BHLH domain-containing protein n=1 Tax=Fistulifera solaris TaxID=1519565 RepID=A0A1Z5JY57_FISSO|nr:hypothetical protein FisN_26Hh117 [Fistulifera solaris]|eukprot:GAX18816.1 hypothetical protein FisN_26Hh117 [Fistulifera solaris]